MRLTKLTSEDQNNKYVVDENQMEVGNAVGGVPYTMSLNVPH